MSARQRVIRRADFVTVPWKNGGGITWEIARHPATGDFDWRLSMADMPVEARFSSFPGVTRHLALIAGKSLSLRVDGETTRMTVGDVADFDGSAEVYGAPDGAGVIDLNLMVAGGRRGALAPLRSDASIAPTGWSAVVALVDGLHVGEDVLDRFDCVIVHAGVLLEVTAGDDVARPLAMVATVD